jgi:hypothetical protein
MRNFFVGIVVFLFLLNQPTIVLATAKTDLDNFKANRVTLYDTKGHPKAKNLRLTLPYPPLWNHEEGRHPNIVQKIMTSNGNHLISTTIHIIQSPMNRGYSSAEINNEKFRKNWVEDLGGAFTYLNSGATQIDGENAIWCSYIQKFSMPTGDLQIFCLSYSVIYSGKQIMLIHGVGGVADDPVLKKSFDAYLPIFQLMTTRVIFPDKWTR